jgi:hypothetical protein
MQHVFMIPVSVFHVCPGESRGASSLRVHAGPDATLRTSSRSLLSRNAMDYANNERNGELDFRIYSINIKAQLIALN